MFDPQGRPKMTQDGPKTVLKSFLFDVNICLRFWSVLGSVLVVFGAPLGSQVGAQIGQKINLKLQDRSCDSLGGSWGDLWPVSGGLGAVLGRSWGGLGRSWAVLGGLGAVLGGLGAVLWQDCFVFRLCSVCFVLFGLFGLLGALGAATCSLQSVMGLLCRTHSALSVFSCSGFEPLVTLWSDFMAGFLRSKANTREHY